MTDEPDAAPRATGGSTVTDAPRDRAGRAAKILEILDQHYPDVSSFLTHESPFQLLVAVMLSAQCTDERVNAVTPALFAVAPDAAAMAKLGARKIRPFIKTCGLAGGKARNIAATSRALLARFAGNVPTEVADLEALPGVGHKTACVVVSQAFGTPVFPVDTHIHRLAGRWQLSRARNVEEVERDLMKVFPKERWNTLHLQLIAFGRSHCTAKHHDRASCPVCSWAMSRARETAERRQGLSKPKKKKKKAAASGNRVTKGSRRRRVLAT